MRVRVKRSKDTLRKRYVDAARRDYPELSEDYLALPESYFRSFVALSRVIFLNENFVCDLKTRFFRQKVMPQIVDTEKIEAELVEEVESVRSQLKKLESQIFDFEGSYLRETLAYGNAVKVHLVY